MNKQQFRDIVGNKVFTATNIKKDGTERTFNARLDVAKYTKGGANPIAGKENMITVFEMKKKQYRSLNLDTLKELKAGGKVYKFGGEK